MVKQPISTVESYQTRQMRNVIKDNPHVKAVCDYLEGEIEHIEKD